MFLRTPFADRSRFYLAYRAVRDKRPISDAQAVSVAPNGERRPMAFDGTGAVASPPTLAELNNGTVVEFHGAPFQLELELRCAMPSATRVDVEELGRSLAQVNRTVAKLAGPLFLIRPQNHRRLFPRRGDGCGDHGRRPRTSPPGLFRPSGWAPFRTSSRQVWSARALWL